MGTITHEYIEAPTTPLNLQFNILYQPRVPTPPFICYMAVESSPGYFEVWGYAPDGGGPGAILYEGRDLMAAFQCFALHLRMDVEPVAQ